jgi:hypothetical protein
MFACGGSGFNTSEIMAGEDRLTNEAIVKIRTEISGNPKAVS